MFLTIPLKNTITAKIGTAQTTLWRVMVSGGTSRRATSPKKNDPPHTAANKSNMIVDLESKVSAGALVISCHPIWVLVEILYISRTKHDDPFHADRNKNTTSVRSF